MAHGGRGAACVHRVPSGSPCARAESTTLVGTTTTRSARTRSGVAPAGDRPRAARRGGPGRRPADGPRGWRRRSRRHPGRRPAARRRRDVHVPAGSPSRLPSSSRTRRPPRGRRPRTRSRRWSRCCTPSRATFSCPSCSSWVRSRPAPCSLPSGPPTPPGSDGRASRARRSPSRQRRLTRRAGTSSAARGNGRNRDRSSPRWPRTRGRGRRGRRPARRCPEHSLPDTVR